MKVLEKKFATGSGNLRGADKEVLKQILGVEAGAVNAFAILNDRTKRVKVVVDQKILNAQYVGFHPMQNNATTSVSQEGLKKLFEIAGQEPVVIDFEAAP